MARWNLAAQEASQGYAHIIYFAYSKMYAGAQWGKTRKQSCGGSVWYLVIGFEKSASKPKALKFYCLKSLQNIKLNLE